MDISTLFTQAAHKWPQALAIKDLRSQRQLTYAELDQALDAFGAGLARLAVGEGERVALLADTSMDYLLADYGCMANGRVRVPLDPSLAVHELLAQIRDAGARVLLFGANCANVAMALKEQGVTCLPLAGVAAEEGDNGGVLPHYGTHWRHSITPVARQAPQKLSCIPTPAFALWSRTLSWLGLRFPVMCLNVRPLWPIAAVALLAHLLGGGALVLAERFDAATFVDQLQHHRAAFSSLVPTQLVRVLRETHTSRPELGALKSVDIGAAAIAPSVLDDALSLFGPRLSVLYGMTEAPWSCYLSATQLGQVHDEAPTAQGVVGRPVFAAAVRIDRPDANGVGEIMLAGPQLMAGYWQQPELSAEVLQGDWLHSGDLGRIREDGLLLVMGRRKEIIRSGGKSIQPGEVIECLLDHPLVADTHVFGRADVEWGEQVCAAVVLNPGAAVSADQLQAHCRERLSRFKVPRQVYFVEALPRSHYGKIQLNRLLEQIG